MTMLYSSDGFDYEGVEYSDEKGAFVLIDDPDCILDPELEWEFFEMNYSKILADCNNFVAVGNLHSRYGLPWQQGRGGKVITEVRDARDFISRFVDFRGSFDIRVDDENGRLSVTVTHHDGGMTMEVKELTKKGYDYYCNHMYDLDDETMNDHLFDTPGLSREVNLLDRAFKPAKKTKSKSIKLRKTGSRGKRR